MTDERLNEMIDAWLTGEVSEADAALLSDRLRIDEAARERFLQLTDVHACLTVDESLWTAPATVAQTVGKAAKKSWFSRYALTSVAAGIVLGVFVSSIVFASIATRPLDVKRYPIQLSNPGFETELPDTEIGIPSAVGIWSGDISGITQGETGIKPLKGRAMVRVAPHGPKQLARLYQVVDLTTALAGPRKQSIELELSASFNSASEHARHFYGIHVMAFDAPVEGRGEPALRELADDAVASASQLIKVTGDSHQWQPVTVKIKVTPSASRLLLCLVARSRLNDATPAERYVDDVKLFLVSTDSQPPNIPTVKSDTP